MGRDNNQPTKLYGASGAMSIYQRYLANQTPTPLVLTVPEDVVDMGVDSNGNFVCSGGMRSLPVWTTQPDALCRQGEMMQQQQLQQQEAKNPFNQSGSSSRRSSNSSNSRRSSRKRATASRAGSRICSAVTDFDQTTRPLNTKVLRGFFYACKKKS